jgi:hypothetical protein
MRIQIFAGLAALCGIVAISKVEFGKLKYDAESLQQNYNGWKYAIDLNTLICCVFLLLSSGATLALEIVLLVVSVVKKTSKVFVIVVSYYLLQPSTSFIILATMHACMI